MAVAESLSEPVASRRKNSVNFIYVVGTDRCGAYVVLCKQKRSEVC